METKMKQMRLEWAKVDDARDAGLTIPEGLVRHIDLRYGEDECNLLDVYYPEGTAGPLPTIISIHGGGWFYGDKELYSHYCLRLAKRGFTVVNFTYRLAPEHKYPAALEDCCHVLDWVRENAQAYCIDLNNLFTVGDSAGGQLSFQLLTMLTNEKYAAMFPFGPPKGLRFNACAMNCGCYFMPVSRFLPPKRVGVLFESYFPEDYLPCVPQLQAHKYVTRAFPPTFVMTSRNDYLRAMAAPLHLILRCKGVESTLHIYGTKAQKEIGHVFHLNCRSELADKCNEKECAFFREHMS